MRAWPRFLPDLTLWHQWHAARGTLPGQWAGLGIPAICRALAVPTWDPVKPWRLELPGLPVREISTDTERMREVTTPAGTLTSRWTLGPDRDWWQSEYPVKTAADFPAARAAAEARCYSVDDSVLTVERLRGDFAAIELPPRPWSELFHSFLGWSEGLILFLEEPDAVAGIAAVLEEKLDGLERALAGAACGLALSPDNLDGQFIAASAFEEHLAGSYARAVRTLASGGKELVVHVGGPVSRLLPGLAACGVACVEGICGPPQGDSSLTDARAACGPGTVLWGGIPQDSLLAATSERDFTAAAEAAFSRAGPDAPVVVGVADRVPVQAVASRIEALARMS
jgi:hypothetical protein